jgi:hypothetical protein
MEFFVIKLKGKDLYFNSDSEIGNFLDKVPALFDNETLVDELFMMDVSVYTDKENEVYYLQDDFEKRKVKLNLAD